MSKASNHKPPQHKVADLWMLAILILIFWPFLLIGWAFELLVTRRKNKQK